MVLSFFLFKTARGRVCRSVKSLRNEWYIDTAKCRAVTCRTWSVLSIIPDGDRDRDQSLDVCLWISKSEYSYPPRVSPLSTRFYFPASLPATLQPPASCFVSARFQIRCLLSDYKNCSQHIPHSRPVYWDIPTVGGGGRTKSKQRY